MRPQRAELTVAERQGLAAAVGAKGHGGGPSAAGGRSGAVEDGVGPRPHANELARAARVAASHDKVQRPGVPEGANDLAGRAYLGNQALQPNALVGGVLVHQQDQVAGLAVVRLCAPTISLSWPPRSVELQLPRAASTTSHIRPTRPGGCGTQ